MTTTKSLEILKSDWVDPNPEKKRSYPPILNFVRLGFGFLGRLFPVFAGKFAYKIFTTPRSRAAHRVSDKILESARIFEFLYGKQILKGYEWGKGDRTVLLVHGWESRGTGMRSFVPELVEAGFRVVAFDGPAHGNSGGRRTNLPRFAGAVKAAIHHIGGVYGIVTHSFGGASTVYALRHLDPDLRVEKLVFMAVPGSIREVFEKAVRVLNIPSKAAKEFEGILRRKMNNRPLEAGDVISGFGKVNVGEVLIVHDRNDADVPFQSAKDIFEAWDNAGLLITEGYGHFRIMKNPDVVDKVVSFVRPEFI